MKSLLLVLAMATAACAADAPFDVQKDGFAFPNYANSDDIENLTPVEMVRLFGETVHAGGEGENLELVPVAEEWMEEINRVIDIGHCEGLAVLSSLFYLREQKASDFGAPTPHELTLEENSKLQREIALWWATQLTDTTRAARLKLAPNEALEILRGSLPQTTPDKSYTIQIWMPDHTRGHAITPARIVDVDEGHARIIVYDNNFPSQERFIEVDRTANSWSYSTQVNPSEQMNAYTGDAETKTLMLTPCGVREKVQELAIFGEPPFSEDEGLTRPSEDEAKPGDEAPDDDDEAGAAPDPMQSTRSEKKYATGKYEMEIALTGEGVDLLIKDKEGHRLGAVAGKIVNEIPGADVIRPLGGIKAVLKGLEQPRYRVPGGPDYQITLTGTAASPKPVRVSCLNRGAELVVEDITIEKGQTDTVYFSPDGTRVAYRPSGDEHPTLTAGFASKGPDFEITTYGVETSPGATVALEIVPKTGTAKLQVLGSKGTATVAVEVERAAKDGVWNFKNDGVELEGNDAAYLHFASWRGPKEPMRVDIDKGGDGKLDSVTKLSSK